MTETRRAGSEPFEWIELDVDFCELDYSVSLCTASLATGGRKCFNSITTCQDLPNYTRGVLTLRFCQNGAFVPNDGNYWFPYLTNASITPASINPGGGNRNRSALGTRATLTATFSDHPHSDRIVDKYRDERVSGAAQQDGIGYDPITRSTFWAKFRSRNQYLLNRPIRHYSGYIKDGGIVDIIRRDFVVTGFDGPNNQGSVSIQGKDILALTTSDKAMAPVASEGRLTSDITDSATSFLINPVGAGAGYPASGTVRIDGEAMTYTRIGDNFNVTRSTADGTIPAEHKAGAKVQLCLRFSAQRPDDIVKILLRDFSGISEDYLDLANWAAEIDSFLPRLYSTLITEPVKVSDLLSEITQEIGFYIWFDERANLVRLRALRPAEGDEVVSLDDLSNFVSGSVSVGDDSDQLVTDVVVNYARIDPTKDQQEPANYRASEIVSAAAEKGEDRNRGGKTLTIYSRWIDAAGGQEAIDLGERIIRRYSRPPKRVSFQLHAKDRDVWIGSFATATTRLSVTDEGLPLPLNIQVISAKETKLGSVYSYSGQQFFSEPTPDANDRVIRISADMFNVNLRALHDAQFPPPVGSESVTFIIRSGVKIGGYPGQPVNATLIDLSSEIYEGNIFVLGNPDAVVAASLPVVTKRGLAESILAINRGQNVDKSLVRQSQIVEPVNQSVPAIDSFDSAVDVVADSDIRLRGTVPSVMTGVWPGGVTLKLIIEAGAIIQGHGGSGGVHYGRNAGAFGYITGDGGDAIDVSYPVTIQNNGLIHDGLPGGPGAQLAPTPATVGAGGSVKLGAILAGGGGSGFPGGLIVGNLRGNFVADSSGWSLISEQQPSTGVPVTAAGGFLISVTGSSGGMTLASPLSNSVLHFWTRGTAGLGTERVATGAFGNRGRAVKAGANLINWELKGSVTGEELD